MSSHGPIITEEGLRTLGGTVSRITQGILLAIGIVSTVFSIAGEYSHGHHYLQTWLIENVAVMGALLHLVLVLLVLFPGRVRKLNEDVVSQKVKAVTSCLNRFFIPAWTWIWVFFGLFYTTLLFKTMSPEAHHDIHLDVLGYESMRREAVLMDVLNVGSTLFILLTYYFVTPSFLRKYWERWETYPRHKDRTNSWWTYAAVRWTVRWALFFAAALVVVRYCMLWCPDPNLVERTIAAALGLTSAFALGAFAGRLDSQFIQNWNWVIPLLFLYACIQSFTNVLYEEVPIDRAVFTYAAFTMKCLLFIFVSNFFERRKATYYAFETVEAKERRSL